MLLDPQKIVDGGHIQGVSAEKIRPASIDLIIHKIYRLVGSGAFINGMRYLPTYQQLKTDRFPGWIFREVKNLTVKEGYILQPNSAYSVVFKEKVKLPSGVCAFLTARSTINRLGIQVSPNFWDPGFEGPLALELNTSSIALLGPNESIAQVYFLPVQSNRMYDGIWKNFTGEDVSKVM